MSRNTNDEQLEELIHADRPMTGDHKTADDYTQRVSPAGAERGGQSSVSAQRVTMTGWLWFFLIMCFLLSVGSCTLKDIFEVIKVASS